MGPSPSPSLTHDLRFLLGVVVLGTGHLHLHKGTNDPPPVFGKVPGPQDLGTDQKTLGKRWEQRENYVFASHPDFLPIKSPWLCELEREEMLQASPARPALEKNNSHPWKSYGVTLEAALMPPSTTSLYKPSKEASEVSQLPVWCLQSQAWDRSIPSHPSLQSHARHPLPC